MVCYLLAGFFCTLLLVFFVARLVMDSSESDFLSVSLTKDAREKEEILRESVIFLVF